MNSVLRQDFAGLAVRLSAYNKRFEGTHFLMTGAAGFIGSYITGFLDYLNREILEKPLTADLLDTFVVGQRRASAPDGLRLRQGDASKGITLSANPDYLIHAAGIASPKHYTRMPVATLEAGCTGTHRMLELAQQTKCRSMLFFSSSEVYGDPDPQNVPTKETYNGNVSTSGPRACYDESKRMGETWSFLYAREYGVPVKIVRPFNVYGPGFHPSDGRVIPNFIENAAMGLPLVVYDRGQHTRTFCYLADAVEAMFHILFSDVLGEAFNIGVDKPEITVSELAQTICELVPRGTSIIYRKPEVSAYSVDNPTRRCADISKLVALTGFQPAYSLRAGLERTLAWYSEEYGTGSHTLIESAGKQS